MGIVNPPSVGENIREIRKELGLTLGGLSKRSGVSKAMLSQIEAAKVNPTVTTVWKIAQGLNTDINILLKSKNALKKQFSVVRKDTIPRLHPDSEDLSISVLTPLEMADDLEMYLLCFHGETALESMPHKEHSMEYLTVIEGSVEIQAGENISLLQEGDFISYHCDIEHAIKNIKDQKSVVHLLVRFSKRPL